MSRQGETKRVVYRHPLGRYEVVETTGVNQMGNTYRFREAFLTPGRDARGRLIDADKIAPHRQLPDEIRLRTDVKRISEKERACIRDLWQQGWTIRQIANKLLRSDNTINDFLKRNGMRSPKDRRFWTEEEHRTLVRMYLQGESHEAIGQALGRTRKAVSHEICMLRKKQVI